MKSSINLSLDGIKYEWGCGNNKRQGFVGVDIDEGKRCDIVCDRNGFDQFPLNVASEIFSSHFIEHLEYYEVQEILTLWGKLLKHGGNLYICFPDLRKVDPLANSKIALNFAYAETRKGYDIHKSFWSSWLMCKFLKEANYTNIREITSTEEAIGLHCQSIGTSGWNTLIGCVNP